ncbi:hypothetical protein D3C73_283960 [compost metagenome]
MTLSDSLDAWAAWVYNGQLMSTQAVGQTGKVMEMLALGVTGPGHNGASKTTTSSDLIEASIEAALMRLAASGALGEKRAAVLRAEYLLPVRDVARAQEVRAITLKIPLRTYKRSLAAARDYVLAALEAQPSIPRIVRG